jgi:hypothetical protein
MKHLAIISMRLNGLRIYKKRIMIGTIAALLFTIQGMIMISPLMAIGYIVRKINETRKVLR